MEIDSVSNETIPEVPTDLGTPEINEKRQAGKCGSEGTQTDFPGRNNTKSFRSRGRSLGIKESRQMQNFRYE